MLRPGQIVDRYEILARLGEGGMATVYLCRHTKLKTRHALKVHTSTKSTIKKRFAREGRVQASLQHVNVVSVSDVIDLGDRAGLVMEYVDGPSLSALLRRSRLPLGDAVTLFRGIAAGIGAAHINGFVHRDLKPANILLSVNDSDVRALVTDFGLAKNLVDAFDIHTRTGATLGTPSYMPPEQIRDASTVDHRADMYGLGCLLYALCCGRPPYRGSDVLELLERNEEQRYYAPERLAPDMPRALGDIIRALLHPSAEVRLGDVGTLLVRLDALGLKGISDPTIVVCRALQAEVRLKVANQCVADRKHEGVRRDVPTRAPYDHVRTLIVAGDPHARKRLRSVLHHWSISPDAVPDSPRALSELLAAARRGEPYRLVLADDGSRGGLLERRVDRDARLGQCQVLRADRLPADDDASLMRAVSGALTIIGRSQSGDLESAGQGDTSVLLVEDNPVQRVVVSQILQRMRYRVVAVGDTREAQRALLQQKVDVVLLDLHLPDAVGMTAIRAVRSSDCRTPIVVMSADDRPSTQHEAEALNVAGFLVKPVDPSLLANAIENAVHVEHVEVSVLDVAVLARLGKVLQSEDALDTIVDMFLRDLGAEEASWTRCLSRQDRRGLPDLARRLQPAATHLGAKSLEAACERVLAINTSVRWSEVEDIVAGLLDALSQTGSALQAYRNAPRQLAG